MPTGYTAGIINGEITTFEQFAKKCMRAFGATIHMRDDPMDKEYEPQKPSDYHKKSIQHARDRIEMLYLLTDRDIVQRKTKELEEEIERQKEEIQNDIDNEIKLRKMLEEVRKWQPPTGDHNAFKQFMIEQLEKTMDFDGVSDWRIKKVNECRNQIYRIDPATEREAAVQEMWDKIKYHEEEHKKVVQKCKESNEWVEQLINSINQIKEPYV